LRYSQGDKLIYFHRPLATIKTKLTKRKFSYERIKEFFQEEETIKFYLERIELSFTANKIANEKKDVVSLGVVGSKTYTTLRSFVAPVKPRI